MNHSQDLSNLPGTGGIHLSQIDEELRVLCEKIRTAEGASARHLPVQVLSYLAKKLISIEIDVYVEECLPMVTEAAHAFVRAMGTFSDRHADDEAVERTRLRLIQALDCFADEVRVCKVRSEQPNPRIRIRQVAEDKASSPATRQPSMRAG
jgi:hypothetical protein